MRQWGSEGMSLGERVDFKQEGHTSSKTTTECVNEEKFTDDGKGIKRLYLMASTF
jgi:hypothetical protein